MAYFLNNSQYSFKLNIMKKSIYKFGNLLLTIGLLLISVNINSQELSRAEKKMAKKDRQYFNFQVLDTILHSRSFVLEADYLENQYGVRSPVLSSLNFIMLNSPKAVLQTGSNSYAGYNGVGGVTAEGNISGLKIVRNEKNLTFFLRFSVVTEIGIYDISMTISSDRFARATISGLTRGKLVYDGRIQTLYNSGVYKGRNSI
jgi:hypothetical protein